MRDLGKKKKCGECGQKLKPKDPRTVEEALEFMEVVGHKIVRLEPWMLKFFEFRQRADGSSIYRVKPSMIKAEERKSQTQSLCEGVEPLL